MDPSDAYHELYVYTMGRPGFILQHVVDAVMAQRLDQELPGYKAVGAICALVGLYLHCEREFTGFQVQNAHRLLGQRKRDWPAIARWCGSVRSKCQGNRDLIVGILQEYKIV